jgi:phospholipid/cholesterol/gamma-HCH transport system substrate-binding protein
VDHRVGRLQATVVGCVIVVCFALASGGLFLVGAENGWGDRGIVLETAMSNVHGLRVGTRVRVLGIPVGQVRAVIAPQQPGESVIVQFNLASKYQLLIRADAKTRLVKDSLMGERVLEIDPGGADACPVTAGARLPSEEQPDWQSLTAKVDSLVANLKNGEGSLGKLLTDDKGYEDLQRLLQRGETLLAAIEENYQSAKQNWMVQKLVKDRYQVLYRPDAHRYRKVHAELELFEPGRAVLTDAGRALLDQDGEWLHGFDRLDAEVVVAAFNAGESDARLAELLTRKQADAVLEYLKDNQKIHKTGWWSRRKVSAHGFGSLADPNGAAETPDRRVEIVVFVPTLQ